MLSMIPGSKQESQYIQANEEEDQYLDTQIKLSEERKWRRRFFILLGMFTVTLLFVNIVFFGLISHNTCSFKARGVETQYSSLVGELPKIEKYFAKDPDGPKFVGKPRKELDDAWHNILQGTMIRLSAEELSRAGNATSIAHKDGGFVGGLGISHSLHCLKRLKQYHHPDYYYSHESQDWEQMEMHIDHCLESLRQAVMCSPDTSIYTLEWTPHSRVRPSVGVPQPHVCSDWSALHEWMLDRAASYDDMEPPPPELYEEKVLKDD